MKNVGKSMLNFKTLVKKNNLISLLIIFSILLTVWIGEAFYTKITNNRLHRQDLRPIALDELSITDLQKTEENTFVVTGPNPSFVIERDTYAQQLELKIQPIDETTTLSVGAVAQDNPLPTVQYSGWNAFPQIMPVKGSVPLNQQPIHINTFIGEAKDFSIDVIEIDATIPFNTVRFFLIANGLIMLVLGIRYRKVWGKKPALTFLILALYIGCSMSLLLPPYCGFDEREHFVKAYKTATPSLGIRKSANSWPDKDGLDDFFSYHINRATFTTYEQRQNFMDHFSEVKGRPYSGYEWSTADTYTPVPYVFSAMGILIGKLCNASLMTIFYLGRLSGSIAYAVIGALIIKKAVIKQKTILLLCLFPGLIFQFALYTADLATFIFALAAVTLVVNWKTDKNIKIGWKESLFFSFLCALTLMAKLPYFLICLLILLLPQDAFVKGQRRKYTGAVFAITAFFTLLTYVYATISGAAQWAVPGMSVSGQILFVLRHPLHLIHLCFQEVLNMFLKYWTTPINKFAYLGYTPEFFPAVALASLFFVTLAEDGMPSNKLYLTARDRLTLFITVILTWGLVCSVLYLTFNPVGANTINGIQPRYFAPLLLPLILMASNHTTKTKITPEFLTLGIGSFAFLLNQYTLVYLFLLTNL